MSAPALTILPVDAATDPALTHSALRVLIALPVALEWAPISAAALAADLRLHPSTVYRAIRILRDRHYLLRRAVVSPDGPRSVYRVNLLRQPTAERSA